MLNNNEFKNLINQAKSEAKTDAIKKFFSKNSKTISMISIVAVVGVIAYGAFSLYQKSQQEKFSEVFHQALIDDQMGNSEKAKESLKKIYETTSAPSGIRSLASMRYAAILLNENKKSEAAEVYQNISHCSSCVAYVKDLAGLLLVKTWMSDENEIGKDDLISRIEKVAADNKEMHFQVSEQKGQLLLQQNNLPKAYEVFESIAKSPEVPQNVKARSEDAMKDIVSKGFDPNAKDAAANLPETKK